MGPNEYRCEMCQGVFAKGWTSEEAKAEAQKFFAHLKPSELAVVCDDCFRKIFPNGQNVEAEIKHAKTQ